MIEAGRVGKEDVVLEIGPGEGVLTEKLLGQAGKVIAVEKDHRLIPALKEKFAHEIASGHLELVHDDILTYQLTNLPTYKLIANLPYYISGAIFEKFLGGNCQPSLMVLLVQKEVAKRIVATNEKESLLSISVKAYGAPKYIATVAAGNFVPKPKVDSAVLLVDNISKKFFDEVGEARFFEVVRAGFAHKRKQLAGNLKERKGGLVSLALERSLVPPKARAENLSVNDWKRLVEHLNT